MRDIPDRWADLGEFIRQQREMASLSLRRLSDIAGISNPYLSQIERGLRKPSAEILQQIARALRISAETLYVRAGILDADRDRVDLVSQILSDRSLDESQRQALVRIYLSFRAEHVGSESYDDAPVESTAPSSEGIAPEGARAKEALGNDGTHRAPPGRSRALSK
ncbi:MAG: helix-turn-helix domain-containing protein [Acidimicrobiales bacterium]